MLDVGIGHRHTNKIAAMPMHGKNRIDAIFLSLTEFACH